MANLILYLLRHGESVSNVKRVFAARKIDLPLSDMGIQQATMQAKSLRDLSLNSQFGFSALYASSLLRARHTANIVGQWCGLEPIFSDDLMEVDVGVLDGESQEHPVKWAMYEEVIKKWEQGLHNVGFQDGESLNDIEYRFRRFLEELESKQAEPEDEIRNGIKRSEAVHEAEGMSLLCHCVARNEAITKQPRSNHEPKLRAKRSNHEAIPAERSEHILVVGHCLLFMAVIWLFCENHGPTLEDGHMGRGHLSIIKKNNDKFRILKFNISPETSAKETEFLRKTRFLDT